MVLIVVLLSASVLRCGDYAHAYIHVHFSMFCTGRCMHS